MQVNGPAKDTLTLTLYWMFKNFTYYKGLWNLNTEDCYLWVTIPVAFVSKSNAELMELLRDNDFLRLVFDLCSRCHFYVLFSAVYCRNSVTNNYLAGKKKRKKKPFLLGWFYVLNDISDIFLSPWSLHAMKIKLMKTNLQRNCKLILSLSEQQVKIIVSMIKNAIALFSPKHSSR